MRILIIGPSWVGDMMMSHSLYQQIKIFDKDAIIDVIAPLWCAPILNRMPEIDTVLISPVKHKELGLRKRYKFAKNLTKKYDLSIVLPNSFKSALIPYFARIPQRTGWLGEKRYIVLNDLRSKKDKFSLLVRQYVALCYPKWKQPAEGFVFPKPYLLKEPYHSNEIKQKYLPRIDSKIVIFCPGAAFGKAKCWPHYRYAELANLLHAHGYTIVILGSKNDTWISTKILDVCDVKYSSAIIDLSGKTSLLEASYLLELATLVVSNDSGLMHIAAALSIPLIALYGITSPEFTPPLGEKIKIIRLTHGYKKMRTASDDEFGYHISLINITLEMLQNPLKELNIL